MLEKIINFIRVNYNVQVEDITGNSKLVSDLGLTSFQLIEMCFTLEKEFGVEIEEDALMKSEKVKDVVAYIENVIGAEGK